jgi:hypothetical protein
MLKFKPLGPEENSHGRRPDWEKDRDESDF